MIELSNAQSGAAQTVALGTEILPQLNTLLGLASGSLTVGLLIALAMVLGFFWFCCKKVDEFKIGKDGIDIVKDEDKDMVKKVAPPVATT